MPRLICNLSFRWNTESFTLLDCLNLSLGKDDRTDIAGAKWVKSRTRSWLSTKGGREIKRIERRPYAIRQITGAALGYEIHDQTTTDLERMRERRPEFHGYELDGAELPPGSIVQLEDAAGNPISGSQRTVRILGSGKLGWSILLPRPAIPGCRGNSWFSAAAV